MADFDAHLIQAKKNCRILSQINSTVPDSWDWQVTSAFYVAVHLMNAHLAIADGLHYKSHEKVKNTLFKDGPCKIDESVYLNYVKLEGLSRRSRYLCSEKKEDTSEASHLTHDRHLSKAIKHLDAILTYMASIYKFDIELTEIDCIDLKGVNLNYFKYAETAKAA
jgi:hypothetical protein